MSNPWEEIRLDDYENHMKLNSVRQLQTMNAMMKEQLEAYPVSTAAILGVAGGNGLEHVDPEKYRTVYGIDINEGYLQSAATRYPQLNKVLACRCLDLVQDVDNLPQAELVIANLLIEYIGYEAFQKVIRQMAPRYVSCVIQINTDEENWVSDSPYLHVFDRLDEIHHQMDEKSLSIRMQEIGYKDILQTRTPLPNGKALIRMDFLKEAL